MTISLKKVELNGFRGALNTVPLDFPDNGKGNIILYGEGGSGKTTFTEAIEWFYKDKIVSLEREFCWKDSYFNLRLDKSRDATVKIEFSDAALNSTKTLPRVGASTHDNESSEFYEYLGESSKENFLLSHADLQIFVDEKGKTEKLEHFAKLTGFEKVIETRDVFMKTSNALRSSLEFSEISGQLKEAKRYLVDKIGTEVITEESVMTFLKQALKATKPELKIETLEEVSEIVKKLNSFADTSDVSKRKYQLETVKDQFNKSEPLWGALINNITEWTNEYKTYLSDAEAIQKESLLNLYTIGKKIIASEAWADKEKCPLCGNMIDGELLIEHLSEEIAKIEATQEKKKELDSKYKTLNSEISDALSKLNEDEETIRENKDKEKIIDENKTVFIEKIIKAKNDYQELKKELHNKYNNHDDIAYDFNGVRISIDELKTVYGRIKELLQAEIGTLKIGPEIQQYRDTARLFENILKQFIRTRELENKKEIIDRQVNSLKAIQKAFEDKEKEIFSQIIKVLSKDIDTYYSILNPGEGVEEITLFPTEDKGAGRGIEISYKFHGSEQYPAKKYLSESHRNSLGISIFLASARYFNKTNKFLVLDDIYTSLDVNHRERLISLFRLPSLLDRQFLITTHDLTWFKTLQRALQADSRWKFMEIRKWRIDSGIEIVEAPESIKRRIESYLDKGETFAAVKSIRSYYEETLKRIAKKLEIRVPYRESANWNPDEFYSGIGEKIKGSSIESEPSFTSGNPIGFLANLSTHENDESITSGTVKSLVDLIDNFLRGFYCSESSCEKPIWYAKRSDGRFQCQCGTLHCG